MKKHILTVLACMASACASDPQMGGATPSATSPDVPQPMPAAESSNGGAQAAVGGSGSRAPSMSGAVNAAGTMALTPPAVPTTAGSSGTAAMAGSGAAAMAGGGAMTNKPAPIYNTLMSGEWTLEPGSESTRACFKKTLTEDLYIAAIRPISPQGTHHSLLSMGEDPSSDCTESVAEGLIYAAAAGTTGLELPEGVAIKLPAGRTLKLGLHVFNGTDKVLTGTSGLEVRTLRANEVEYESQAVLVGPAPFLLQPKMTQKLKHTCNLSGKQTVFAVFPHMHEYGRHLTTSAVVGGVPRTIHDGDFQFAEQRQYPLDQPLVLNAGDTVTAECTFENTSDDWVQFGESTTTEMCISVLFAYPPVGSGLCVGLPE